MAVEATIVNGQLLTQQATPDNLSKDMRGTSTLGKDQFLQILVAEMQYQDPLAPTSNTEWVSQMATFSQIEELQNMSGSIEKGQAQDLVGEYVIVTTTDSSGETSYVSGEVESLEIREDGTYLSIGGYLYNIEDLYSVVDEEYYEALVNGAGNSSGTNDSTADKESGATDTETEA